MKIHSKHYALPINKKEFEVSTYSDILTTVSLILEKKNCQLSNSIRSQENEKKMTVQIHNIENVSHYKKKFQELPCTRERKPKRLYTNYEKTG